MLRFAFETFQHGLEHHLEQSPLSRKFALMHLDQAVELLLKEKIVQLHKTIYKSDNITLNMRECFNSLENAKVDLSERARLEDLHDLRNAVQHKGLTPDAESTDYYVEIAYSFAKRFLPNELGVSFEDVVDPKHRRLMEGAPQVDATQVQSILKEAWAAESPSQKMLTAYTAYRRAAELLGGQAKVRLRGAIRDAALANKANPEEVEFQLREIHRLRGLVLGTDFTPTDNDALKYLEMVTSLLRKAGLKI